VNWEEEAGQDDTSYDKMIPCREGSHGSHQTHGKETLKSSIAKCRLGMGYVSKSRGFAAQKTVMLEEVYF